MSEQDNNVTDHTQKVTVDDASDTDTNDNTDDSAQDSEDVEQLKMQNKKLFERAKKAEGFVKDEQGNWVKKPKPVTPQPSTAQKSESFDLEDVAVLVSQVPLKEDREIVKKYAKLESKTLEDALNDPIVKGILRERAEMRKSSEVANTSGSKRTTARVTDESIVENFKEGKSFDPEKLAEARINLRKQEK